MRYCKDMKTLQVYRYIRSLVINIAIEWTFLIGLWSSPDAVSNATYNTD